MTAEQYRAARRRLGWSQSATARLTGVNLRTSQRWEADHQEVPPTVERLLYLAETVPGVTEALLALDA